MPCIVVQKVTNGMAGIQTKQNWQYYIYIYVYTHPYISTHRGNPLKEKMLQERIS